MFLSYLTLFIALCLSAVAAFYSIAGLTAIFAAAVIPIIIMGGILEVAKIVTTLWLHEYWRQAKWTLKAYLVPAVAVLMLMTSMGIFGFLSKAHLDQTVPAGDVSAQVSLFDEKIKNERDTIANARTLLNQLDKAWNDIGSAPDREVNGRTVSSAERALTVRRQQARDREALSKTIEAAQARIVKLQEERAPIASQARKVEAEVGPIKYVAALIYGDNPDTNTLEKAVRWVIIMIVIVFDPLAIMLLLAATESLGWSRKKKEGDDGDPVPPRVPPGPDHDMDLARHPARDDLGSEPLSKIPPRTEPRVQYQILEDVSEPEPDPDPVVNRPVFNPTVFQEDDDEGDEEEHVKSAMRRWKEENPGLTIKEQRQLLDQGKIDRLPWMDYVAEETDTDIPFGDNFPVSASKGDMFVRVDTLPTMLYKFNGTKWIQVDKNLSDRYAYNDAYIDHLIAKISSGEYDPDLLNDAERLQLEQRLKQGTA